MPSTPKQNVESAIIFALFNASQARVLSLTPKELVSAIAPLRDWRNHGAQRGIQSVIDPLVEENIIKRAGDGYRLVNFDRDRMNGPMRSNLIDILNQGSYSVDSVASMLEGPHLRKHVKSQLRVIIHELEELKMINTIPALAIRAPGEPLIVQVDDGQSVQHYFLPLAAAIYGRMFEGVKTTPKITPLIRLREGV